MHNYPKFLIMLLLLNFTHLSWGEHVKGYVKKNGTYVAPYERRAPHSRGFRGTNSESTAATMTNPVKIYKWVDKNGVTHYSDYKE